MRIIAGTHRSRSFDSPKGNKTRPTSDRARETVFNILVNMIELDGTAVLDLFSGSGAFAFEALSRGAEKAVCIDNSSEALHAIKANSQSLNLTPLLIRGDVYNWLESADNTFDVIFADPPYDDPKLPEALLRLLFTSRLLTPDSIVIIEHRSSSVLSIPINAIVLRERAAGEATFTFLALRDEEHTARNLSGDV